MTSNGSPVFLTFKNVHSSTFLRTLLFSILSSLALHSFCQTSSLPKDTSKVKKGKSPTKALIFSAVIPGLGQVYNKKYWKVPIVYAAFGSTIYFYDTNNKSYKVYKQAYINKTDTASSTIDLYPYFSAQQLQENEKYFRRYRDLSMILTGLFYTLNIVDAYVDAQLSTFDVSDNLSMQITPALNFYSSKQKPAVGMTMSFRF
jgi:hypothetical protein